eukprot:jgi/Mesvir1/21466/Mv03922-RA.1
MEVDQGPVVPMDEKVGLDAGQFDVDVYASNYTGHTKIARLLFIAGRTTPPVSHDALRMAIAEIKKGANTQVYRDAMQLAGDQLGLEFDQQWVDTVEHRARQQQEKLEQELSNFKTNLIKESIRMGHNDLGDHFYQRGDLQNAFKSYVRTRDYCTTGKHIIAMCLNVICVSIELGQFVHVTNYVQKAEQTPETQDVVIQAKLRCASGLSHLEAKKYKLAARRFLDTSFELGHAYSDVLAPQDVAVYGGLCALATLDRSELKQRAIDNLQFRNFLELVPDVRELIDDFYASRYASCLDYLQKLRPMLLLDIHLHDHVESLYGQIRQRALIQYVTPFTSVDLSIMADAFKTNVAGLEKELAALIMDNQVQARIDSHNKILYARHADQRHSTFQRALAAGEDYMRDTRSMLLRANLITNDVTAGGGAPTRRQPMVHHPGIRGMRGVGL